MVAALWALQILLITYKMHFRVILMLFGLYALCKKVPAVPKHYSRAPEEVKIIKIRDILVDFSKIVGLTQTK